MLNKIKNIKLSKSKYIYTVIAGLIIIAIGTTFAWWRWSSDINALVNGKVCVPEIVFVGGTTINGTDLLPVRTKEEGLSKDINVNLNNTCDNDTAVLNLNLKPDVLPEGLADSSFKWALYKVTTEEVQGVLTENLTYVNDGNFNGKRQYVNDNDLISIATDLIVTENISTYRLFIWIDGTMDNASTMGDNFFKFSIYGTGKDAIYREYVMKNPEMAQSTTYFINSDISKDTIESVDIVSFSNLPEGAIYVEDVSSNSDESIKLYYLEDAETNLKKVYLASSNGLIKMNTSMDYMFAGLTHVESLDLSRLDTSNVTSMVGVFYNSPSLTSINMSTWDTGNVTHMRIMFRGASGLTSLDVSSFDTSKVTNMAGMFNGCSKLVKLNLSNFYTPQLSVVTDIQNYGMFIGCSSLEELDLSNFNTEKISDMSRMFMQCKKLKQLDLSSFNTVKVTNMYAMFYECESLEYINLSSFNTSVLRNMGRMFFSCYKLKELDLSNFNTSSVTSMGSLFSNCRSLKYLDLKNFDTSNVSDSESPTMFTNCTSLEYLDVSNFSNNKMKKFSFQGLSSLKTLVLTNFKTDNFTSMENMFNGCSSLKSIDVSSFNTSNVTKMYRMFYNCSSLESIDLSNFITNNFTDMRDMFLKCKVTSLDLSNFENDSTVNFGAIFRECEYLSYINLSSFDFANVTFDSMLFYKVPDNVEIIVKDCTQYNKFVELFGNRYTNLHTVNNDNCTV